ncbi:hypothetical protein CW304_01290 [Bacillus sp. UFRGS-B20]|nr:hypothetical protein CW304_01290 [Bacillus sp. UFRGS-B20]
MEAFLLVFLRRLVWMHSCCDDDVACLLLYRIGVNICRLLKFPLLYIRRKCIRFSSGGGGGGGGVRLYKMIFR